MSTLVNNIYWLAGLLDGEGCFQKCSGRNKNVQTSVRIRLEMTDFDIVERAAKLLNVPSITRRVKHHVRPTKPSWYICLAGKQASSWMMTLYSLLSKRRQAKIRDLLTTWKAAPGFVKTFSTCHPDRRNYAWYKCRQCYDVERRLLARKTKTNFAHS